MHLETKPWSDIDGARANLTLEVDEKVSLSKPDGSIPSGLGFNHKVSQCRVIIPSGMCVFSESICMPIQPLAAEFGVCVSVTGSFGSIFLCSMYCQFNTGLEQYLDAVLLLASRTLVPTRTRPWSRRERSILHVAY
ncbi:GM16227 [Drosophila sechellia]|uniref:GM16227 n=1 Tax=Drosophila sechellia TaxID=7238 RepID=B4IMX1_DROSE|nr:GM16227 [Drosophila sechellia]